MEKMPYQDVTAVEPVVSTVPLSSPIPSATDWRTGLPTLTGSMVMLRELRLSDAPSLLLDEVANLVDAGIIRTTLGENLGKIDAATLKKAHAMIESGRTRGKLVLTGF